MSIKDIQVKRVINKIITEQLKTGVNPDMETMTYLLYQHFNENPPGLPTFKSKQAGYREKTDKGIYNQNLNDIDYDLDILYESITRQNKEIIDNFVAGEMDRNSVINELIDVNQKAEKLVSLNSNTNPYRAIYNFNFTRYNDYLDESTAFIDLNYNNVTLHPLLPRTKQYNVESINLSDIQPADAKTTELASINNAVNDYENASWMYKVENIDENNNSVEIVLELELEDNAVINQLEVISNTKDLTNIKLELSADGNHYNSIANATRQYDLYQKLTYYFKPQKAKKARIYLTKDFNENDEKDTFLFSIKNISFYNTTYNMKGYIESNYYEIDKNAIVDKISLTADEMVPDTGKITYNIVMRQSDGTEKEYNIIPHNRKKGADSHKVIDLSATATSIDEMPVNYQKNYLGENEDEYNIRFYSLAQELDEDIVKHETKLFKGINQWQKEVFQYYYPQTHRISLNDWSIKPVEDNKVLVDYTNQIGGNNVNYIRQFIQPDPDRTTYPLELKYIPDPSMVNVKIINANNSITDYLDFSVIRYPDTTGENFAVQFSSAPGQGESVFIEYPAHFLNYKFTRYIYCDKSQVFKSLPIDLADKYYINTPDKTALYINNRKIAKTVNNESTHQYKTELKEGWNKIVYIAYIHNPASTEGILDTDFMVLSNSLDEAEHIVYGNRNRAVKEPMNYTDMYTLKNKVLKQDHSKFGLQYNDSTQKYRVVVNNNLPANYAVRYIKQVADYDQFKLKAYLETEDKNFTPLLNSARVNFYY